MLIFSPQNLTLRTILVASFAVQVFSAVGLVGYFSFRNGQTTVQTLSAQLRNELTARIEQQLRVYIKAPHAINRLNSDKLSRHAIVTNRRGANQLLQQVKVAPYINGVYCGDHRTGNFLGVSRADDGSGFQLMVSDAATNHHMHLYRLDLRGNPTHFLKQVAPYDPRRRPWYREANASGRASWSELSLDFSSQLPTVTASLPAYSNDMGNQLVGVCGTDLLLSAELRLFLQNLKIGQSGEAFIVDRSGTLISSSTDESLTPTSSALPSKESIQALQAIHSQNPTIQGTAEYLNQRFGNLRQIYYPQQLNFKLAGQPQFLEVLPFGDQYGLDWLIVLVVPEIDFMQQVHANTRMTILLCLTALGIATGVGLLAARWVTQPILKLKTAARALANGEWEQPVELNRADDLGELADCFNSMAGQLQDSFKTLEHRVQHRTQELTKANSRLKQEIQERHRAEFALQIAKQQSEKLLLNILPISIAEQLKTSPGVIAEQFEDISILFADIVNFTPLANQLKPIELVNQLNEIFSAFDQLAQEYDLEKIKTIGDAYMVVGGLPIPQEDHAEAIAEMALRMQQVIPQFCRHTGQPLEIRIGIHVGPVVAGVIGIKKFSYDLWGDTVNVAHRMESHGKPGKIQVTPIVYERLKHRYLFEERGKVSIKGKGTMQTYWLLGRKSIDPNRN
ncbi:MAG: adenylate/guanylate cyclase domain-containing protein [Microcoleaceae cyanobacterium]